MNSSKAADKFDPREIRRKLGLNQQQFWSKIGVTQSGGSRYESGRNMPRPVRELLRLVHVEQIDIQRVKREDMDVIDYLKTPPNMEELRALLDKLGMKASELVRRGESVYQELYAGKTLDEAEWIEALCQHPILIERPIVVCGDRAVVGRPPEKALALIDSLL